MSGFRRNDEKRYFSTFYGLININSYKSQKSAVERIYTVEKDCIFCKIANNETQTEFLFENDILVVFKDINPAAPVHLLIVPKKHIRSINDLQDEEKSIVSEMIMTAREMADRQGIAKSGYKIGFNVERGGGQVIFHLHLHLVGGWRR